MRHVTLSLFQFDSLIGKFWMFGQMGLARMAIRAMPGLKFHKMMGTGAGAGFSTRPNFGRYAILCVWDDEDKARKALGDSKAILKLKARCTQATTLHMRPTQSRGQWSAQEPFADSYPEQADPVVALTRATLSAKHVWKFWSHVPSISDAIEQEPDMRFMLGMGEVPWLHQVTFSIWDDREAMARFSRSSATHGEAVRLAYKNGWFKENLFARFNLLKIDGDWKGLEDVAKQLQSNENLATAA